MKILNVSASNFASYESLDFNFDEQGLCLISGPTGAGKSTLLDVVPWVLFGVTSKNGSVDDIRNWNTNNTTSAHIYLEINQQEWEIYRSRGPNDLFYSKANSQEMLRGKDLQDTQKQINQLLGLTPEAFLSGAYFHEFSQSASFFTTTAKIRRQIVEQMADVTLSKTLADNLTTYKKEVKAEIDQVTSDLKVTNNHKEVLSRNIDTLFTQIDEWEAGRLNKLETLKIENDQFEYSKQVKIADLEETAKDELDALTKSLQAVQAKVRPDTYFQEKRADIEKELSKAKKVDVCPTCGHSKAQSDSKLLLTKQLYAVQNEEAENISNIREITILTNEIKRLDAYYKKLIAQTNMSVNNYQQRINDLKAENNPYKTSYEKTKLEHKEITNKITQLRGSLTSLKLELSDLDLMLDVNSAFRSQLVKTLVDQLETNTNQLLEKHFDAELRVGFEILESDKIDVTISKDGNIANYGQLSKGQRQLLRLCYGISVMSAISNYSGVDFNCIMLDEPLDGCDEQLRVAAFGLLEELALKHTSVFCIEHNETLKTLFHKRYEVGLIHGTSQIKEV